MMIFIVLALAAVGQPTEEPTEAAAVQEVRQAVDDLTVLIAFARDRDLAAQGYAPEGWAQPELVTYETELGLRPSLLPLAFFLEAVAQGKCAEEDGDRYKAWETTQAE